MPSRIGPPNWFRDIPRKIVLVKAGQTIYRQGDECNRVYYINHGIVKLSTLSRQGKTVVVGILGPGDFVGVECLSGEEAHQTSAVALVQSSTLTMRSSVLMRLFRGRSANAAEFVVYLVKRYIRVERELINYLIDTSEKRLARALLLIDQYSRNVDPSILETITQETLADIVGTTRPRISLFMSRFRDKGYIDYDDRGLKINPSLQEVLD